MKRNVALLLVLILCLGSGVVAHGDSEIKGSLVIVGGALRADNDPVFEKFIALAGGADNAKIGIVPAASGSPYKYSQMFMQDMVSRGVKEENVLVLPLAVTDDKRSKEVDESTWRENGSNIEVAQQINDLTGIWFVGGDQTRITDVLLKADDSATVVLEAIWGLYYRGGVIGGTSAGAAIMSDVMIAGGDSLGALSQGYVQDYDASSLDYQNEGGLIVQKGLGFFKYGIVDQHFDRKGRLGRLAVVGYDHKEQYPLSFGVEENTAMVFNNQTMKVEVVGAGGVFVLNTAGSQRFDDGSYAGMQVSYLEGEDSFDLNTQTCTMDSSKYTTIGYEYLASAYPDSTGSLSANQKLNHLISYGLVDNASSNVVKTYLYSAAGDGFMFQFSKADNTEGYWGQSGAADLYSFENVRMDIKPVQVRITVSE